MVHRQLEGFAAASLLLIVLLGCGVKPQPQAAEAPTAERSLELTGAGAALERVTTDPVNEAGPVLSPDGKSLLFYTSIRDAAGNIKQRTLVSVNPDTRAQRTLFTSSKALSYSPSWLPDQSGYVYVTNAAGSLSIVRALTAAPNAAVTVIVGGDAVKDPEEPAVSPSGKRVAFSVNVQGTRTIAVVDLDGSRLTLLGPGAAPSWSPDEKRLAFNRRVGDSWSLFTIDAETGTGLVQLTNGEYTDGSPSWSPDGKRLVFVSQRGAETKDIFNLFVVNADGTGVTQLTDGSATNVEPFWGSDGWIYFSSNQEGNYDIWRLRPSPKLASAAATSPGATGGTAPAAPPTSGGCTKDTDCKGDRICSKGACVNP